MFMSEPMGWPEDPDAPRPEPAKSLLVEEGLEVIAPMEGDAQELFAIVDENRAYLRKWLPWLDDVKSVDDEISLIRSLSEKRTMISPST